jgi:hypothetical protein
VKDVQFHIAIVVLVKGVHLKPTFEGEGDRLAPTAHREPKIKRNHQLIVVAAGWCLCLGYSFLEADRKWLTPTCGYADQRSHQGHCPHSRPHDALLSGSRSPEFCQAYLGKGSEDLPKTDIRHARQGTAGRRCITVGAYKSRPQN